MTHSAKQRKKRKNPSKSENSPTLPQPKRIQCGEPGNAATNDEGQSDKFIQTYLESPNDPRVKEALSAILKDAFLQYVQQLETTTKWNQQRIVALETELRTTKSERDSLQRDLRELQQYTRRNALRVYNPSWPEPTNQVEPEDTDALILKLAEDLDVPLAPWEIGRSHRVGRPRNDGSPRPIIVKFISYNVRRRVYDARKKLRDTPRLRGIYINEDLTPENNKLAYDARQLKRNGQLYDTFTRDGRIFVRRNQGNRPVVVKDFDHMMSIVNDEVTHPAPRRLQPPRQSNAVAPTTELSAAANDDDSTMSSTSIPLIPSPQAPNVTFGIATHTSTPRPTSSVYGDGQGRDGATTSPDAGTQGGDGEQPREDNEKD